MDQATGCTGPNLSRRLRSNSLSLRAYHYPHFGHLAGGILGKREKPSAFSQSAKQAPALPPDCSSKKFFADSYLA